MRLQSFIDERCRLLAKKKKQLKRKAFLFKAKIFFTCVLPVVIILLTVKIIQTFVRIEVRKASSAGAQKVRSAVERTPVTQTSEKPDFITPTPVSQQQ